MAIIDIWPETVTAQVRSAKSATWIDIEGGDDRLHLHLTGLSPDRLEHLAVDLREVARAVEALASERIAMGAAEPNGAEVDCG